MTEEILYSDMINHYSLKITEMSDMLTDILSQLKNVTLLIDESWRGNSANAFFEQMADVQKKLMLTTDDLGVLSALMGTVMNTALNDEAAKTQDAINDVINNAQKQS